MCVIICCFSKRVSPDELNQAQKTNRDGGGIAWVDADRKRVEFSKGLDAKEIFELSEKVPFPYIVHFRSGTSGPDTKEMTHPFPISKGVPTMLHGRSRRVLFHNWIWSNWKHGMQKLVLSRGLRVPDGDWSDTRALAFMVHHVGRGFLNLMDYDRFAMLSGDGFVRTWGTWTKGDGMYYSNTYWKSSGYTGSCSVGHGAQGYLGYEDTDEWEYEGKIFKSKNKGGDKKVLKIVDVSKVDPPSKAKPLEQLTSGQPLD